MARGLTTAIARTGLSRERFEALLHGRGHDLYDDPIPDMAALEAYADATSGELSVLAAEVLGARDPATLVAARSVGVAWGLVGVVRATAFLAARRRLLLPADRLVAHAVEAESVFLGRPGGGLANVVEEVVRRAEHRLGEARAARPTVARRAIPALLPAMIARRHVARLRRDRFAVFGAAPGPAPLLPLALWWAATTGRY